jgi:hypothetical protein
VQASLAAKLTTKRKAWKASRARLPISADVTSGEASFLELSRPPLSSCSNFSIYLTSNLSQKSEISSFIPYEPILKEKDSFQPTRAFNPAKNQ